MVVRPAAHMVLGSTDSIGKSRPLRIFSSQRGAKSQEYCMYFKIEQRICGGKRPAAAEDTFNQWFL